MDISAKIIQIITSILKIEDRSAGFSENTQLLGDIPEFDSMAVVSIIEEIENQFEVIVDEDEISAELFETVGTLSDYIKSKM